MCGSLVAAVCGSPARAPATRRWGADALARSPARRRGRRRDRVSLRRAAGPHALHGRRGPRCVLCVYRHRRRGDRKPPLSAEHRPRSAPAAHQNPPAAVRGPPARAERRVANASSKHASDTGLNPTSAGSAISSTDFVGSLRPPIVSSQGAAPRLPLDLVARAARAPTVHAHQIVTSSAAPRDCNLAHVTSPWSLAGARPPGEVLSGTLL